MKQSYIFLMCFFRESKGNIIDFFSVFVIVYSIILFKADCKTFTFISIILLALIGLVVQMGEEKSLSITFLMNF